MEVEVIETVAGVTRLLRHAAELAWTHADAAGHRSSRQLLALRIDSAADEESGLLPRRAWLDGPAPVGDDTAELLGSADQLLRRICVVGAPSRLLGLRGRWSPSWSGRRIPVPVRDQRTVGEHLAESDAVARESLLDVTPSHGPAIVRTRGRVVQSAAQLWAVLPARNRWLLPPRRIRWCGSTDWPRASLAARLVIWAGALPSISTPGAETITRQAGQRVKSDNALASRFGADRL